MKRLTFLKKIKASPEKVWKCLWEPDSYKKWTAPFCEGTYYKTEELKQGNKIHFLSPDGHGMYSIIDVLIPKQEMSFRHIGEIKNFEEQALDEKSSLWTNAIEKYELIPIENGSEIILTTDTTEEYLEFMSLSIPLALDELKKLAEN